MILRVDTFDELAQRPFADGVNAFCWPRMVEGDFGEILRALAVTTGVLAVDATTLRSLSLSAAGRRAADLILDDLRRLDELGRDPTLNAIAHYERDERGLPVTADVHSFHADHAPVECDTWLCTYWGEPSEGLANADARRLIDDPTVSAALRDIDDESFALHYRPIDGARPYSFGVGNLWRIAVDWPGSAVPPCLHRAPTTAGPRLLLIC